MLPHSTALRTALAGLGSVLLLLGGCGGGESDTSVQQPTRLAAAQGFNFKRQPLPGLYGASAVAPQLPPFVIGTANNGTGILSALDLSTIGLGAIYTGSRTPYDVRTADFNNDGFADVISSVYSPTNVDSWAYLFFGSAGATFTQDTSFGLQYAPAANQTGYRGRTETVVVADFNNDGAVDIFLPTYTYLDSAHDLSGLAEYVSNGPPPNVYNALQSFLLLNDGTGHFTEAAVPAGISMHSKLSGLHPDSTDPEGVQPEGAQAVDFNMDGLIDLYVGGHLFINQGVDAQGVPHFKDVAASYGLTQSVLRAAPPWDPTDTLPDNYLVTDEGAKFIDWNNDGRLDLLLYRWDWGPGHGARLFEFNGTQFIERVYALTYPTATCKQPQSTGVLFFSTSRPPTTIGNGAGINAYDLDNDGLEDVLTSGDNTGGSAVFRNYGCGFVEVSAGDLTGRPGGAGGMALADLDNDGKIDVINPENSGEAYYDNEGGSQNSFSVEVLGPAGQRNQYGRVVQVLPSNSTQIFTRVVDGGSGYLSQNQYPLTIGTPFSGVHTVKVYFAPLTKCTFGGPTCHAAVLTFAITPGQSAKAYAPTAAAPNGSVVITSR